MATSPTGRRALLLRIPAWTPWAGLLVPLLLGAALLALSRQDRERALQREATAISEGIAQDLVDRVDHFRGFAFSLAAEHDIQKLLSSPADGEVAAAQEALLLVARASHHSVDQLRVVDLAGVQRAWIGYDEVAGIYAPRTPDPPSSTLHRDWFLQGASLPPGQSWMGPTELYRRFGKWTLSPGVPVEPYFRLVAPVFAPAGQRLGFIVLNLRIEGRVFGVSGEELPWLAVGEDGHFIHSTGPFRASRTTPDGNASVPTLREEFGVEPTALPGELGQVEVQGNLLFYRRVPLTSGSSWLLLRPAPASVLTLASPGVVVALVALWSLSLGLVLLASNGLRRMRAQRESEHLARLLDSILRAPTGLGLLVTEPDGRVLRINAGAQAIFGITPDAEGTVDLQGILGEGRPGGPEEAPEDGGDYRLITTPDGRRVLATVVSTPLEDAQGEVFGNLVQVQDMGGIQAREEMLRSAALEAQAASRLKSAFLATMSHEIRTPMNGILGMVRVLKATDLAPDQAEIVGVGERAATELLQLLDTVLDLSRLESGRAPFERQPFSPAQVSRECAAMWRIQAEAKGLAFTEEMPAEGFLALGDAVRLRQVLNNLLGNACKFTERGRIALRMKASPLGERMVLVWEVADTGLGIPSQAQAKVFEPFTQVDEGSTRVHGGTGLGLAICREIAARMGGSLELESQPGKGSVFRLRVTLPLVPED